MSTVTSPDGTVIGYDRYGGGPAVIFIGGAGSYRAIDEATTQTARRLAAEGFTAVDYDRRGRGAGAGAAGIPQVLTHSQHAVTAALRPFGDEGAPARAGFDRAFVAEHAERFLRGGPADLIVAG